MKISRTHHKTKDGIIKKNPKKKPFNNGDKVVIFDKSWEDPKSSREYTIRVRGTVVGREMIDGKLYYMIKPNLADVEELYDVDYEEYKDLYDNPQNSFIPSSRVKSLSSVKANSWGYF